MKMRASRATPSSCATASQGDFTQAIAFRQHRAAAVGQEDSAAYRPDRRWAMRSGYAKRQQHALLAGLRITGMRRRTALRDQQRRRASAWSLAALGVVALHQLQAADARLPGSGAARPGAGDPFAQERCQITGEPPQPKALPRSTMWARRGCRGRLQHLLPWAVMRPAPSSAPAPAGAPAPVRMRRLGRRIQPAQRSRCSGTPARQFQHQVRQIRRQYLRRAGGCQGLGFTPQPVAHAGLQAPGAAAALIGGGARHAHRGSGATCRSRDRSAAPASRPRPPPHGCLRW